MLCYNVKYNIIAVRQYELYRPKNEGFKEAKFLPFESSVKVIKYDDERKIIKNVIEDIKFHCYE